MSATSYDNTIRHNSVAPESSAASAKTLTLLIAEDEHLLARHIATEVEELGHTVVGVASNGQQAVDLAEKYRPDMALMDLRMPEMDGLQAGKIIYDNFNIPIVILSAYSDQEYVDRAGDIGVFGYLIKPANSEALRVALAVGWQRWTEQAKLTDQIAVLEQKLEDRKLVERAKGMIMQSLGLNEAQAMRRLQKQSRDSRRPMVELAKAVIDAQELLDGKL